MSCGGSFLFVPPLAHYGYEKIEVPALHNYRIEHIGRAMCAVSGISKVDMFSSRRTNLVAHPRQIAMLLSKIITNKSLPEIGRRFAGRDHTTVLHAIRKYGWMIPLLKAAVKEGSHPSVYAAVAWDLYKAGEPV